MHESSSWCARSFRAGRRAALAFAAVIASPALASAQEAADGLSLAPLGAFVYRPDGSRADQPEPEPEPPEPKKERPVRIGPMVGSGLPSLINFGLTAKLTRYFGLGASFGLIPTTHVSLYGDATVSYQQYEGYLRLYPFGGGFYLGSGLGYATVKGSLERSADVSIPSLGVNEQLSARSEGQVRSMVVTPKLGYMHVFDSGFLLGLEGGAQIPVSPSQSQVTTTLPSQLQEYSNDVDQRVKKTLDRVGQQILPTFGVQMGWLF